MALLSLAPASAKTTCTPREIQRQDCRLASGDFKLELLNGSLSRDDGKWHAVDAMPLSGEGTSWEKVRFDVFKGWPILQLWIWDKAAGEASVQQLQWFVADIRNKNDMKVLASGVVRRRRMKQVDEPEGKPASKPVYTLDAMEKHSLKLLKDGRLEWTLGPQKKILEKVE